MGEPVVYPGAMSNVVEEHEYSARVTFGAGTVSTIRAMGVVVERPTATTLKLTFPTTYTEITGGSQFWAKATGADPLQYQVTTNNLATTGDITLTCVSENSAGTATAPASGDTVWLSLKMYRNILNDRFTSSTA